MCFSQVLEEAGARTSGETWALVSVGVLILSQALSLPRDTPSSTTNPWGGGDAPHRWAGRRETHAHHKA